MMQKIEKNHEKLRVSYDGVYLEESLGNYDIHVGRWPRNRFEAMIFFAGEGKRVLDVGCGNGLVLYNLRKKFKELYGVEISTARVETARRTLDGLTAQIEWAAIDEGTPFSNSYFDVIVTADVIEHVIDVFAAFYEFERLLCPGGKLVLSTPNIAKWRNRIKLLLGKFPSTAHANEGLDVRNEFELLDGGHFHYFTYKMLENLAKMVGLVNIKRYGIGRFSFLHNIYPPLLSGAATIVAQKPANVI